MEKKGGPKKRGKAIYDWKSSFSSSFLFFFTLLTSYDHEPTNQTRDHEMKPPEKKVIKKTTTKKKVPVHRATKTTHMQEKTQKKKTLHWEREDPGQQLATLS